MMNYRHVVLVKFSGIFSLFHTAAKNGLGFLIGTILRKTRE